MAAITGIYIDGFKSFAPVEGEPKPAAEQFASLKPGEPQVLTGWYPIKPLTVLAGANSSGKSTFLQALLVLKQTYDSPSDPGPLKLTGPNVEFDHGGQLAHYVPRLRAVPARHALALGAEFGEFGSARSSFSIDSSGSVSLLESGYERSGNFTRLLPDQEIQASELRTTQDTVQEDTDRTLELQAAMQTEGIRLLTASNRSFVELHMVRPPTDGLNDGNGANGRAAEIFAGFDDMARRQPVQSGPSSVVVRYTLARLLHVPGITGMALRRYPNSRITGEYVGLFTDYHASIVADWTSDSAWLGRADGALALVEKWLKDLGMTSKLVARVQGGAYVEIFVGRTLERPKNKKNDLVNIADVGVGVAQVLPILVALAAATEHNTLVIQQPELHLHPRAQAQLAEIICGVIKEKRCTVLIETHSDVFLRRLRSVIAEGELPANDAVFHWFKRDEKSGATTVTTVMPDEQGRSGEWPVDFADVQLDEQKRYIKATQLHAVGRKAA